jgi:WD40 repeat protein
MTVAPKGRLLFSSRSQDETVTTWDTQSGELLRRFHVKELAGSPCLAVAPDDNTIALRTKGGIVLIDALTGKTLKEISTAWGVNACVFVGGGKKLLVPSADHKWHLWDTGSGRKLLQHSFPGNEQPFPGAPAGQGYSAYAVTVSPDDRLIAYGSQSKFLAILDVMTGVEIVRIVDLPDGVSALAFSPSGRTLAWGGWRTGPVRLLETASAKERYVFDGHKGRVGPLKFSPDGSMLASRSSDGTALIWDAVSRPEMPRTPPSAQELSTWWNDLAGADAPRAYQAILKLAGDPARSVSFLDQNLQAIPVVAEKELSRLILDLGSDVFTVREKAMRDLERLGEVAEPACRKALEAPDTLEVRGRLESLTKKFEQQTRNPTPAFLRTLRALECLELVRTSQARAVLTRMSQGAPQARATMDARAALERLSRQPKR